MDWSLFSDFSSTAWHVSCKGQEDFETMLLCAALVECPIPPETPLAYVDLPLTLMFRAALGSNLGPLFDAAWGGLMSPTVKRYLGHAQSQGTGSSASGATGSRAGDTATGSSFSVGSGETSIEVFPQESVGKTLLSGGQSVPTAGLKQGSIIPSQAAMVQDAQRRTLGRAGLDSKDAVLVVPCRGSLLSNLGCIHLLIGKPVLAGLLFHEALRSVAKVGEAELLLREPSSQGSAKRGSKETGSSPSSNHDARLAIEAVKAVYDRIPKLAFNLGLQQMACGESQSATKSFQTAASATKDDPLVWLRLAECYCLEHQKWDEQQQINTVGFVAGQKDCPQDQNLLRLPDPPAAFNSPGQGSTEKTPGSLRPQQGELDVSWRVVALVRPLSAPEQEASKSEAALEGEVLLQRARCCTMNAQYLIQEKHQNSGSKEERKLPEEPERRGAPPVRSSEKSRDECHLEEAEGICLTLMCYIDLCSGNLLGCLSAGRKALSCEEKALADKHRLAAAMYMAEALYLLGRPSDAEALLLGVGEHGETGSMIRTNLLCIRPANDLALKATQNP